MHTIGVISKDIELMNELIKIGKVTIITKENIHKYTKQKIDILIIEDEIEESKELKTLCNQSKLIMLYDGVDLEVKLNQNITVVTFGFNHKSTVTISSVNNEKVIMCIQRRIKGLKKQVIEPQEVIIENSDEYNINRCIIKKIIEEIVAK